jgi:hypothetical protein
MHVPVALLLGFAAPPAAVASDSSGVVAVSTAPSSTAPSSTAPSSTAPAAVDGFVVGHLALAAGAGLAALSTTAFVAGFEVERELRAAPHDRGVVDAMLLRRGIAAGVAWPAAALAVAGVGVGVVTLALVPERDEPTEAR